MAMMEWATSISAAQRYLLPLRVSRILVFRHFHSAKELGQPTNTPSASKKERHTVVHHGRCSQANGWVRDTIA